MKKITLRQSELLLHFLIIIIAVHAIYYGGRVLWISDFYNAFYRAGLGLFDDPILTDTSPSWIYKDWLHIFFIPLTWFSVETAYLLYSSVNTIMFMVLTHLLTKKKYGELLVIASLPIFRELLQNSNTQLPFALLLCFPLPTLFTVLFKPHYVVFSLLHPFRKRGGEDGTGADITATKPNFRSSGLLSGREG